MYTTNILKCNSFTVINYLKYSKGIKPNLKFLLETMPKVPKHIPEAQKQRKLIKQKFSKHVPGRITLQVLGTGAMGAPRSLYVFSDQSRYLFNCGEGTQRLAHEHKMKLSKLEHIFITQSTWSNIGGLPGTALTIQDVGVPQIMLHGPEGLDEIFMATRRFVILRDLKIEVANCDRNSTFEDNVMQVKYVPIKKCQVITNEADTTSLFTRQTSEMSQSDNVTNGNSSKIGRRSKSCSPHRTNDDVEDCIDYYAHEQSRQKIGNSESHVSRLLSLLDNKKKGNVMCYICKLQPRPGTLSLDKCVKMGVPSGPLLGKLKNGEDIVLPSGVTVRSKDVCEPDDPGPVFLVVDCPTEDYLEAFVQEQEFNKYQKTATDTLLAYLVIHFTPPNIIAHTKYREWMDRFSPSTHHIVLNETNTCMGSESVHRVQYKLNLLHKDVFPLLGDNGSKYDLDHGKPDSSKRLKTDENEKLECNFSETHRTETELLQDELIRANTSCNFHLRPKKGLDRSNELLLKPAEYIQETMADVAFTNILNNLRTQISDMVTDKKIHQYPSFLFLGTGSCIPNKTRNTSGILFETSSGNILLDCGEGTFGQLVRFFGPTKSDEILSNIKAIFISHLHADHHIGLIGLLQGRRKALNRLKNLSTPPIYLMAPKQILTWLNFYDRYFEDIFQEFHLVPNDSLLHNEHTLFEGTDAQLKLSLGMSDLSTTYVRHCPNAFGIAFTSRSGYKICYSGDTMPSENLIDLGMRCDLLIHEATMEDELEKEAVIKMHSTTSQAIEVGRNMNAKYILLTHFSQRYAKLPRFNENFSDNVGIAFDNMKICLDELPLLPLFYPALRLMFAEHYEELESKSIKRQLRQEREESIDRAQKSEALKTSDVNANSSEVLMEVDHNQS